MSGQPDGPLQPGVNYGAGFSPNIYAPSVLPQCRSSRRTWLIVAAVVIGMPLLLVVFVVGAGALFILTGREQEATPADRAVLLTAEDLAPWLDDLAIAPQGEKTTKTKYLDDSYEVEYEYNHPDEDHPLYMKCTVTIEPSLSDAKTSYASEQIGYSIGMSLAGDAKLETVEHNDWLQWGEDSKCSVLSYQGLPVGNMFIARKGTKIFSVMISGCCLNSADEVRELLQPRLDRLESYP